jgi:hypothetical protein
MVPQARRAGRLERAAPCLAHVLAASENFKPRGGAVAPPTAIDPS